MKSKLMLILSAFVLIISCSSLTITKDDCSREMKELGLDHGKKGLGKFTDEIRSVCTNSIPGLNLELYEIGFSMGWDSYCTTYNGFQMGKKGDNYKSYCPQKKEELFHEKFLIGKAVYEKNDELMELTDKIKNLSINIEKDSASLALKDELKKMQNDLRTLNSEIQALEQRGVSLVHTN